MFKELFEIMMQLNEEGQAFRLIKPLDSQEARDVHVRVDDPAKYPVGTTLYFMGDYRDDDGFWWVDFVTSKDMIGLGMIASNQPGVIRFTPVHYKDVFRVVQPIKGNVEEPQEDPLGEVDKPNKEE